MSAGASLRFQSRRPLPRFTSTTCWARFVALPDSPLPGTNGVGDPEADSACGRQAFSSYIPPPIIAAALEGDELPPVRRIGFISRKSFLQCLMCDGRQSADCGYIWYLGGQHGFSFPLGTSMPPSLHCQQVDVQVASILRSLCIPLAQRYS